MDNLPQPANLPPEIVQNPKSINLYTIAVVALAAISVLAVLGGLLLAWAEKTVPGEVWTFAGIAIGGLVALVGSNNNA